MRAILLAAALAALLLAAGGPAVATAQESPQPNATGPAIAEDWQQVDSALYVRDWTYHADRGEFEIEFYAERPRTVTVAEAVSVEGGGAGSFSITRQRIVGNQTVAVPAGQGPNGEAAVTITTEQSLARSQGVFLSTGYTESNPFSAFGGTQGLLTGITISCVIALLAAAVTLWREKSGVTVAT
jgi:hypothetical protein